MKKSHSFDIDLGKFRAEYLRAHEDTWSEGDPIDRFRDRGAPTNPFMNHSG